MSTKLTGYVWDGCAASGMKLSSVAIMARLADFSNDEGVCWPSIETIARQIGAGMSTVRTAIARLEAEGWLTRKARRQGITANVLRTMAITNIIQEANQHAKQQIALESQRTQEDIKVAVADDDCASRPVPDAAADRLRKYANSLRPGSGSSVTSQPDG